MSLQGKLPAVSQVKLKGYTLLKFPLMTLSAPKLLAHGGGACWFHHSLLLASHISDAALGIWTLGRRREERCKFWRASRPRAGFQGNSGVMMWKWSSPGLPHSFNILRLYSWAHSSCFHLLIWDLFSVLTLKIFHAVKLLRVRCG